MSYSIHELEGLCSQFENQFFGGKACPNVRNVLVNVVRGGSIPKTKTKPLKRKKPQTMGATKKQKLNRDFLNKIKKQTHAQFTKRLAKQRQQQNKDIKGGQTSPDIVSEMVPKPKKTDTNSKSVLPTYMQLIDQINNPQKRLSIMQDRIFFQYNFLVPRLLGEGKIRSPLSRSFVCVIAWYYAIEDLCEALVTERGVEVLSGGVIQTDMTSVIKAIEQISMIINDYDLLQSCSFPMFTALIEKVFMTYIILEDLKI